MQNISMVVAMDRNRVIGKEGRIPWRLKADMEHFVEVTWGTVILMGRKTYESIPEKLRPLKDRGNLIITKNKRYSAPGCKVVHSVGEALWFARDRKICVIGGAEIYNLLFPYSDTVIITHITASVKGDAFFPKMVDDEWQSVTRSKHETDERNEFPFSIVEYKRKVAGG
ncbi:MAG TPA: dihydrofolate reductase [Candidatus Paceibacterota bacterium]